MHLHAKQKSGFHLHAGWYALAIAVVLTLIGIEAISTIEPYFAARQAKWFIVSVVMVAVCLLPHPRFIGMATGVMVVVTLGLLVFVIMPGVPQSIVPLRNGARCWIDLKLMSLQPAELAKITFVLALAWHMRHRETFRTWRGLVAPFLIMLTPAVLIIKQPDLGTAVLFGPTAFVMILAAGAKLRHMAALAGLALGFVIINVVLVFMLPGDMQLLRPHQQNRIRALVGQQVNPDRYAMNIGYQQQRAMTLIGAGGVTGYGKQRAATIIDAHVLPHTHNDMIYMVIVNRWGLMGGLTIIVLNIALVVSIVLVAGTSRDPFARLAAAGFAGMIFTQAAINICTNIGLLPMTGITLPFVSYGGSSLVTTYATIGLVMNFASRRSAILTRPSFEFDHAGAYT